MKTKKVTVKKSSPLSKFAVPLLCISIGVAATFSVSQLLVHAADTTIHGCVDKKGNLRVISSGDTCNKKETPLDWNQESGSSSQVSPLVCENCDFSNTLYYAGERFKGADLSNAFLPALNISNIDMSGTNFTNAQLRGSNFVKTNVTNANFTASDLEGADFTNANLSQANFTNANLHDLYDKDDQAVLVKRTTFVGTNLEGVVWDNTTCPDGTNSDDNDNTCVGHLNP